MDRRTFIGIIPTAIATARAGERWTVVAHLGRNLNGRAYSVGNLKNMARTAPGRFVIRGDDDNRYPVEGDLANALGCVSAARFIEDRVEVQVRWFGQAKPEGYLTPSGFASFVTCPQGYDAVGKGYRLESFALNSHSAFERATKV